MNRTKLKNLINSPIVLWLLLLLAIAPSTPAFKFLIADSMAFHMLGQVPLLILAGYLIGHRLNTHFNWCHNSESLYLALSGWLWFMFATLFWMLPISLDKALLSYSWDFFKIISLILSGQLLTFALSGSRILSLFFIGSTVMMLFFVGYYYQDTSLRLCNSYLIESQKMTGNGLITLAFLIVLLSAATLYKKPK